MSERRLPPILIGITDELKMYYCQGFEDKLDGKVRDIRSLNEHQRGAYHQGQIDAEEDSNDSGEWTQR